MKSVKALAGEVLHVEVLVDDLRSSRNGPSALQLSLRPRALFLYTVHAPVQFHDR